MIITDSKSTEQGLNYLKDKWHSFIENRTSKSYLFI